MPVSILLDKAQCTLRTHAFGDVAFEDFVDGMEKTLQLLESGVIDANWRQIIDLTDVSAVAALSPEHVNHIATNSPWPAGARRAIVVTEEPALQLAKLYQSVGRERGQDIKLVASVAEAEQWLQSAPGIVPA